MGSSTYKAATLLLKKNNNLQFLSMRADQSDCGSDPCHLAMIVRDNPIMKNAIPGSQCSNGTLLIRDLNPSTLCFVRKLSIKITFEFFIIISLSTEIGNIFVSCTNRLFCQSFQLHQLLPVFKQYTL